MTQPTRPVRLGSVRLDGFNTDVSVDAGRGLAAVAAGDEGLHVVDVQNPSRPTRPRTVDLAGGASHVEALDGIAYVASGAALAAVELATGDVLQTLDLGGAALTGLAREGRLLYTMDGVGTLRAIDASGPELVARGALSVPQTGGTLFVGDGIAYATARQSLDGGFATADVSDPAR